MTSLDFLYIALGVGFIFLTIFVCAMLLNLTLILRDFTKVSENVRNISEKLKDSVFEPLKTLSEMTVGFSFIHEMVEKIRAKYRQAAEENAEEEEMQDENVDVKKEKKGFLVKKLRK